MGAEEQYDKYIAIAIQTVLQRNRNLVHLFMDSEKYLAFIKDLSRDIMLTAQSYHIRDKAANMIEEEVTISA